MSDAVRRYEGYLVRTTGDGIFALFGAPVAYEDHPQRALYAALQMQQELRTYAKDRTAKALPALELGSVSIQEKWSLIQARLVGRSSTG